MTQYAATLLASADESNSLRAQKQIRTLWETELDSLYSEWLQRAPVEGQGAIIAAQGTYMNDLAVQETVSSSATKRLLPCRSTRSLRVNAHCSAVCSITNNRTDMDGGIE